MNTLSWFLYLADVVNQLSYFLTSAGVLLLILTAVGLVTVLMMNSDEDYSWNKDRPGKPHERKEARWNRYVKIMWKTIPTAIVCFLVAIAVPSKQTLYLIAASEVGELAATSKDGQEILDALKAKIKDALKVEKSI